MASYIDGTGQTLLGVHPKSECVGFACPIHHPSAHIMKDFPTHWRNDRSLMERTCPHGVGHPDPDHLARTRRIEGVTAAKTESVHGCDGCCG